MPCFNAEAFVEEAIESALAQTYRDVELVIVDDGSTDGSVARVRSFGDAVRLFTQTNKGPSSARNKGLREATGEFIAYLDADDYWEPHFVESMVSALGNSGAVLAYCGWQNVLPNGKSQPRFVPPDYETEGKRVAMLSNAALWPIHAALARRAAIVGLGGFDENLPACEDYDLWLRLTFARPIIRVSEVLSYYRHHKSLAATDKRGRDAEYTRNIKKSFIERNPALVSDLPAAVLRECIDGGFMRRGYQCYWNRELLSARRIFRTAFREGAASLKDLKYVLPALLPAGAYLALISGADRQRTVSGRSRLGLYHRLVATPFVPWRFRNRLHKWTETRCREKNPSLYHWLHFGTTQERLKPVTSGPTHHFFGYYDRSPWNASGSLLLAHEVGFNDRPPVAEDVATLGIIHVTEDNRFEPLGIAHCWNWQQGAMLQWNPAEPERQFFHNDRRDGRFVGVLRDVTGHELRVYDRPLYAITPDGMLGFSLNFARLQTHRPGYGYAGVDDPYTNGLAPREDGIEVIDLTDGHTTNLISLGELAARDPVESMSGSWHYVNHIQVSAGGKRVGFFHIWRTGKTWRVRLYVMNCDGAALQCLLDTGTISHYDWLDDDRLLVWAERPGDGKRFLLCDVRDRSSSVVGEGMLTEDGHCSFSPDRKWVLNDTYPDAYDMRTLMLYRWPDGPRVDIARLYSPVSRWWGELRCDLHPRWRRDGKAVCVDSVHSGERQMYVASVEDIVG